MINNRHAQGNGGVVGETAVDAVYDLAAMASITGIRSISIILDLKLADENGLDLMRELPTQTEAPVIVLTGQHREEVDRVVGLELGADDYLTKPFSPRELLARIRAVLRRSELQARRPASNGKRARYRFAGWELSLRTRRLTSPSGDVVRLTKGEFALLEALLQSPQRVLSREQLLSASRVHDNEVFDRSIDVQILRLRRKIEVDAAAPELIRTERGAGFDPQEDYIAGNESRLLALVARVDVFLPSAEEVRRLAGHCDWEKAARDFAALGPRIVAIKLGAGGCLVFDASRAGAFHCLAISAPVVDATGAGDAFCGAFMASLLRHPENLEAAAHAASLAAYHAISDYGTAGSFRALD